MEIYKSQFSAISFDKKNLLVTHIWTAETKNMSDDDLKKTWKI